MRYELLLHPNVPKPLHGMSPRSLLGEDWWNKTRQAVYEKAGYKCQCCGVHKSEAKYHRWLEAHETYKYDYARGIATVTEIVALCHSCHSYIHSGLLQHKLDRGEISYEKYLDIISRGQSMLRKAGLKKPEPPVTVADWNKWKIIINGNEYKTIWKSYDDWSRHYTK